MSIMKSKILALSIFCAIGGATQAMPNEEKSLLTITNQTKKMGSANIACKGSDKYGDFSRSINAYVIKPGSTFNFKEDALPNEFAPTQCAIITHLCVLFSFSGDEPFNQNLRGIYNFSDDESFNQRVLSDWVRPSTHLAFVLDDETHSYNIINVNETN